MEHSAHECAKYFHFLKCLEKNFHALKLVKQGKCLLKCIWEVQKNWNGKIGGKDEQKQIHDTCNQIGGKNPDKHVKDKFILNCIMTGYSIC